MQNTLLVTKKDLIPILQVSLRTVDEMIRRHKIPYLKIGRLVRFHLPDVEKALRKFEVKSIS